MCPLVGICLFLLPLLPSLCSSLRVIWQCCDGVVLVGLGASRDTIPVFAVIRYLSLLSPHLICPSCDVMRWLPFDSDTQCVGIVTVLRSCLAMHHKLCVQKL